MRAFARSPETPPILSVGAGSATFISGPVNSPKPGPHFRRLSLCKKGSLQIACGDSAGHETTRVPDAGDAVCCHQRRWIENNK